MSANKRPPSLEELLALKRKNKNVENVVKPPIFKATFLTSNQRQKLRDAKDTKLNQQNEKPLIVKKPPIQTFVEDNMIENEKNTEVVNPYKNKDKGRYKFGWDESEDTSNGVETLLLTKRKENDYSLDLPSRKKFKSLELDYSGMHWSKKPLDKMDSRDWRILREDFNILIKGSNSNNIIRYWKESEIPKQVIDNLEHLNYTEPTPIQRATIPLALKSNDVLGIAETGSGKTLAFLIPAISYVINLPPVRPFESPYVLIIVPTRELAQQIEVECQKFMSKLHFNIASIVGGHSYDENISKLEKGVEILVGTPGRLLDVLEKKLVELNQCFFLVADEADRMIDMGFEKQVQSLIEQLPEGNKNPFVRNTENAKRTTLMFTATMPPPIQKMISKYLINPISVTVGNVNNAVETVVQDAIQVPNNDEIKMSILKDILHKFSPPIVIFVNYQKSCDVLFEELQKWNFKPAVIHGGRSQIQREQAIESIKSGESNILIATDVAARGIDIPNISLVINYQMTKSISEYVHRIGRTGRAGKRGTAITFWNAETDEGVLFDLKSIILKSNISKCPNDLFHNESTKVNDFKHIEN